MTLFLGHLTMSLRRKVEAAGQCHLEEKLKQHTQVQVHNNHLVYNRTTLVLLLIESYTVQNNFSSLRTFSNRVFSAVITVKGLGKYMNNNAMNSNNEFAALFMFIIN